MGDMPKEGGSTTRPILFNGDNYSFWKARMKVFLRSIDEEVWESVVHGWKSPMHVVNEIAVPKPRSSWTKEEKDLCNWNNKANNAIHSAITPSEFRRISKCDTAKEAWDTLMITYEGTSQVKSAKLQVLVTQFEECKMNENDVFEDFYGRLIDIVNMRHNLGDTISEAQIIRKIMRSLPERFTPKIVSIEDTKEIDSMILSEFLGSIKTFEHNHCKVSKNGKGIALKSVMNDFEKNVGINDYTEEELALFAKKFKKFIQQKRNFSNDSSSTNFENNSKPNTFQKNEKNVSNFKPRNSQQIQCHECSGFGHYASKCANTLEKAKNKGLNVTWDDSDNEANGEGASDDNDWNFTAFVTSYKDDCEITTNKSAFDFTDDELTFDYEGNAEIDYDEKFRDLLNDYVSKKKENSNFSSKIDELEKEVNFLKNCLGESEKRFELLKSNFDEKLENFQNKVLSTEKNLNLQKTEFLEKLKISQIKFFDCEKERKVLEENMKIMSKELEKYKDISKQFTAGSQGLDKLLGVGKSTKDRSGLGFDKFSNTPSSSKTVFVKATKEDEPSQVQKEKEIFKNSNFQKSNPKAFDKERSKFFKNQISYQKVVPKCYHCGEMGHIRPKCQNFLKEKISFERNILRKFEDLTKEISKFKNGSFWKSSLKTGNGGKSVKEIWVKKEALKGKDTVFDYSKVKILKRPNPSKLN